MNSTDTIIIDCDPIGQGTVWKVYNYNISLESYPYPLIIKIPFGFSELNVNSNIINYNLIKSLGLPTLKFLKRILYEGNPALIGQNLNCGEDEIFVSPNTLITDKQRMVECLNSSMFKKQEIKPDSNAEIYRYRNKLCDISGFEQFLKGVKHNLNHASKHDTLIEFDSYFFGSVKHSKSSKLSYCIADFDHIYKQSENKRTMLFNKNLSEFKSAIRTFIEHFCETNDNQKYYIELINQEFN